MSDPLPTGLGRGTVVAYSARLRALQLVVLNHNPVIETVADTWEYPGLTGFSVERSGDPKYEEAARSNVQNNVVTFARAFAKDFLKANECRDAAQLVDTMRALKTCCHGPDVCVPGNIILKKAVDLGVFSGPEFAGLRAELLRLDSPNSIGSEVLGGREVSDPNQIVFTRIVCELFPDFMRGKEALSCELGLWSAWVEVTGLLADRLAGEILPLKNRAFWHDPAKLGDAFDAIRQIIAPYPVRTPPGERQGEEAQTADKDGEGNKLTGSAKGEARASGITNSKRITGGRFLVPADTPKPISTQSPKEQRDKWIYNECIKGTPYQTIVIRLNKKPKKWSRIESVNGVKMAAKRYAERHSLPMPHARQSGRRPV